MTKICFLEQPGRRSPDSVIPLTVRRLGEYGCPVEVLVPEKAPAILRRFALDADLYLWKSHERLCDSLAATIHGRGLPLINDYFGTLQVRDKIVTSMRLMDAGLPTPEAYYATSAEQLRAVVKDYPIVVKPNSGRRGQQISVVWSAQELERLDLSYGDIFAQQFVRGSGLDLKAYIVGDEVFGVARPFPVRTAEEKRGEPRPISPEVRDICLRCGELFDLELYGVDLIETEARPIRDRGQLLPWLQGGTRGGPPARRIHLRTRRKFGLTGNARFQRPASRGEFDVSAPRCLLIGAGRVAGGFVAPLLRDAGWEIILVSRNRRVVETINEGGGLWVRTGADLPEDRWVGEISAVSLWDPGLPHLAARADLLATAVGASALPEWVGRWPRCCAHGWPPPKPPST